MTEEDTDTLRCSMLEVMLLTQSLLRLSECSGEENIPQIQTLYFSVFLLLYVMFKDWPKIDQKIQEWWYSKRNS